MNAALTPDKGKAREFIKALTGSPDTVMRFRLIDDNKAKDHRKLATVERVGTVDQVWPEIVQRQRDGYGVFYVVNEVRADLPPDKFATDKDVTKVRAVFIDNDDHVPEVWEFVGTKPDLIVTTSPGRGQALWRVDDRLVDDFKQSQQRLAAYYETDPSVVNPSRVLRLPGTLHQKGEPHLVTFEAFPDAKGDPFKDVPLVDEAKASEARGEPVTVNMLIDALSYIDPTFKDDRLQWLGVMKFLWHGECPLADGEEEPDWHMLADDWSSGGLWRHRTGDEAFEVETYRGFDDVGKNAGEHPTDNANRTGLGTIFARAKAAGYEGPTRIERPSSEVFRDVLGNLPTVTAPSIVSGAGDPIGLKRRQQRRKTRIVRPSQLRDEPDPEWFIEGVMYRRENFLLYAEQKKGKSLSVLDIVLSVALGVPVFGHFPVHLRHGGKVVYMTAEGNTFLKRRVSAWLKAHGKNWDDIEDIVRFVTDVPRVAQPDDVTRHIALIREELGDDAKVDLIVIDTLGRAIGTEDENAAAIMNRYDEVCRYLAESFDAETITISHVGKDKTRGPRGSSAITANFDATAFLDTADDHRVWRPKDNRGEGYQTFDLVLRNDGGEYVVWGEHVEDADTANARPLGKYDRRLVIMALEELGAFGDSAARIKTRTLAEHMFPNAAEGGMLKAHTDNLNRFAKLDPRTDKPRHLFGLRKDTDGGVFWFSDHTKAEGDQAIAEADLIL